jgi:4-amino-4-deoxy-L-arabinose transferase-like glycosyltransferase
MKRTILYDLLIAGALALAGVLARLPYLALIPVFEDEAFQTVYALSIRPGDFMPLVGDDPYTGPFFSYLLAACLRVFGSTPVMPRVVVMALGALTVGLTYLLARALGLSRPWALLAGLLMAANPHHILIASHYAGATYSLPFFTAAFLLALVWAVRRESGLWLIVSGALLGLALQANPIPVLMLPGVLAWFLLQRKRAISLRTPWPYLALVALLVVYAPVIAHALQTNLAGIAEAGAGRSYLWQPDPSPQAFLQNLARLALQLCRQVSGVLEGDELLGSLIGLPLVLSVWAVVGLICAARRSITLPLLAVASHLFIMPWLSNHYGLTGTTRFTNQLTPLIVTAMGAAAEQVWKYSLKLQTASAIRRKSTAIVVGTLFVALSAWPMTLLFRYYDHAVARGETNAPALAFFDDFVRQWKGGGILLDDSPGAGKTVEYFLAVNRVSYDLMPLGRMMEWLATGQASGSVSLILYDDDAPRAGLQADLIAWDINARKVGYGVYTIADARQVRKPTFVFANAADAPAVHPLQVNLSGSQDAGSQLGMIGYDLKAVRLMPGDEFVVNIHWQALAAMPEAYTGFLHLVGPDGRLMAQDDHELGRGFYRTIFWQLNEVIREKYILALPKDAPVGEYVLRAGAYRFPLLERLVVRSSSVPTQDNIVTLSSIHVGP